MANIYKLLFFNIFMKKTKEETTKKILSSLEEKPLSIQEISKKISSNWSTTNEILEELKKEGKVREIVSTEKIRLFKLAREDTYLDIPLNDKGKKIGYYLYNKIKKEWTKRTGKPPLNTDVLKVAVDVLEKTNLNKELPTVWYLFGKIPLLKYSPEIDYSTNSIIEESNRLDKEVLVSVKTFSAKRTTHERMLQQYETYNNELYKSKEKIRNILNKNLNDERVLKELENEIARFYFYMPTKDDASGIVLLVHEFVSLIGKMLFLKKLDKFKKEITDTFNSIWGLIAIYMFFDSLSSYGKFYEKFKNRENLRLIYFENSLQHRISNAKDFLSQLNSIYLNNLKNIEKIKYTKETEAVRNMFFEMGMEKE